jgi:hypothetical protein
VELEEFRRQSKLLVGGPADAVRDRFVEVFVDTKSIYYKRIQSSWKEYADGFGYVGHLWDTLAADEQIAESEMLTAIAEQDRWLCFWDINSAEHIRIPNYWRLPKAAVVDAPSSVLIAGLEWLPEDLYFVTSAFEISYVLTHEYLDAGRDCRRALPRVGPE